MAQTKGVQPRRRKSGGQKQGDLWRLLPEPPEPEDIAPVPDPAAMLRSLGDPPLLQQRSTAGHYLAAVVERAAGLAVALAGSADLLVPEDE